MSVRLNVGKLLWSGAELLIEEQISKDQDKQGVLRGGNTGMLEEDKEGNPIFINQCPRLVWLRSKGYALQCDEKRIRTERMFEAGRMNEEAFKRRLLPTWKGSFLQEEEVGLSWTTSSGVEVTCRPDIVLINEKGDKVYGIENKRISGLWTGLKVLFKSEPKLNHVMQAAHYSMKLGDLPYDLWYSSDSNHQLPKHYDYIPKEGKPNSEFLRFREDGYAFSADLIEVGYQLLWQDDGSLKLRKISDTGKLGKTMDTCVTKKKIVDFYEFMGHYIKEGEAADYLPPVSSLRNLNYKGNKEGYSLCEYCELKDICASEEGSLKRFIKSAEKIGYFKKEK